MADAETKYQSVRIMNASGAIFDEEGENVKFVDVGAEEVGEGQVRVKVEAFAINPVDLKICEVLPDHAKEYVPCSDASGTIDAIGEGVDGFEVGDKVFLNTNLGTGTAAGMIVVKSSEVAKRGDIGAVEAAGLPLVAVTAMDAINDLGQLEEGSVIMINGASGGVGTMAVQIAANVKKYHVIGICSGKNIDMVKELGAAETINYREQNFTEYDGKIDGFLDLAVGYSNYENALSILKDNARFVTICEDNSTGEGVKATMERSADPSNQYTFTFYNSSTEKLDAIRGWVEDGALKPKVHATFPVAKIMDAFKQQKTKRATGKIVVTFADGGASA